MLILSTAMIRCGLIASLLKFIYSKRGSSSLDILICMTLLRYLRAIIVIDIVGLGEMMCLLVLVLFSSC